MKSFMWVGFVALLFCSWSHTASAQCQSFFDVTQDVVKANAMAVDQATAQALKKDGDVLVAKGQYDQAAQKYVLAAEKHPISEIKAMYLWKAACATTGRLDKHNRWVHREDMSSDEAKGGLGYLDQAEALLKTPSVYCHTGVEASTLQLLIDKVRSCINGNYK